MQADDYSIIKTQKLIPVKFYLEEFDLLETYSKEKTEFKFARTLRTLPNLFKNKIIPYSDEHPEDEKFIYLFIPEKIKQNYEKFNFVVLLSYFGHTENTNSTMIYRLKSLSSFTEEIDLIKESFSHSNIHPELAFNSFFNFINYLESLLFHNSQTLRKNIINIKRRKL